MLFINVILTMYRKRNLIIHGNKKRTAFVIRRIYCLQFFEGCNT